MSHVVCSKVRISDLEILKKALEKFPKLKWHEGKNKYRWYGSYANDYHKEDAAYHDGIKPEDYGKCAHCISMPGESHYEIGVVERDDGTYSLIWDFYGTGVCISDYIGKGAEHLMAEYSREFILDYASRNGFLMNEYTDSDGNLVLDMTAV